MDLSAMFALAQQTPAEAAHTGGGVFIPGWVVGVVGALLLLLLGMIGYFGKTLLTDFKKALDELKATIKEFQQIVSNDYTKREIFEYVVDVIKKDVDRAHKDIRDLSKKLETSVAMLENDMADHERNCPIKRGQS